MAHKQNPLEIWSCDREDDTVLFELQMQRSAFFYIITGQKDFDEYAAHIKMSVIKAVPSLPFQLSKEWRRAPKKNITFKVPRFESLYDLIIEATEGLDSYGTKEDAMLQHADDARKEARYV